MFINLLYSALKFNIFIHPNKFLIVLNCFTDNLVDGL